MDQQVTFALADDVEAAHGRFGGFADALDQRHELRGHLPYFSLAIDQRVVPEFDAYAVGQARTVQFYTVAVATDAHPRAPQCERAGLERPIGIVVAEGGEVEAAAIRPLECA